MARGVARTVHLWTSWVFVACLLVQVFLAGLGVFQDSRTFITHRDFGYMISLLALVLLVAAIVGRLSRRQIGLAALVLVLFVLQSVFVALRTTYPAIAALHPVNGFLIVLITFGIAQDAWSSRSRPSQGAASA